MIGNQIYDTVNTGVPQTHGVREALSHVKFPGNVHPGVELPVSIEKEQAVSASLPYHLELASQEPKTAYGYELLDWLKSINHFQYTLRTVKKVAFP